MRPATAKRLQTKRNRGNSPKSRENSPYLHCLLPSYRPNRYLTAPAGSVRPGFFVPPVTAPVPARLPGKHFASQASARLRPARNKVARSRFEFAPTITPYTPTRATAIVIAYIRQRNNAPEPFTRYILISCHNSSSRRRIRTASPAPRFTTTKFESYVLNSERSRAL